MYTCVVQMFMDKTIDSIARQTSNIIQPSAADSFGHTQDTQNQREALHITIINLQKVD